MSSTPTVRNVLYIMCDQLRRDYLSCYGHPHLHTPNIDRLAAAGVRFTRAYTQGTICGPSRMSAYTGRYVSSHQVSWNAVPLPIDELTIGDYLRPAGIRTALVGKTHATPNDAALQRLQIGGEQAEQLSEVGFEAYCRHDGLYPDNPMFDAKREGAPYTQYLRSQGFEGRNPWHDWANAAEGDNGEILSGWHMRHSHLPARVPEQHSETVYTTDQALRFIDEQGDDPWCLHLSYIKPHWPYIAPAPYHALYGQEHVIPAVRPAPGQESDHPVYQAFRQHQESRNFSQDSVRLNVVPTYMGLIKQVDDQLGRLFDSLQSSGRWDDTLIVFTSDHGDYLGDHYLGEKEFLLEPAVGVPLIVRDPRAAADATRGQADERLVETIDALPTFLEALGLPAADHRLEGRSLIPLLQGAQPQWREFAVSEYDYAFQAPARERLQRPLDSCRMYMVRSERWKYLAYDGFRAQLFDLEQDPHELNDLGQDPAFASVREQHQGYLLQWLRGLKRRTTIANSEIDVRGQRMRYGEPEADKLVPIGVW